MKKRPKNPAGTLFLGVGVVALSLLALPLLLSDPTDTTTRGFPIVVVVGGVFLFGLYLAVWGLSWVLRERK